MSLITWPAGDSLVKGHGLHRVKVVDDDDLPRPDEVADDASVVLDELRRPEEEPAVERDSHEEGGAEAGDSDGARREAPRVPQVPDDHDGRQDERQRPEHDDLVTSDLFDLTSNFDLLNLSDLFGLYYRLKRDNKRSL